jgi:hypothetical protein
MRTNFTRLALVLRGLGFRCMLRSKVSCNVYERRWSVGE